MLNIIKFRSATIKPVLLAMMLLLSVSCYASKPMAFWDEQPDWQEETNGGVNYGMSTQALEGAYHNVLAWMFYTEMLLYSIASLCAIYNATAIYIKLQTGEGGFTKSVLMLLGAVLFILASSILMPSFFNFENSTMQYHHYLSF